MTTTESQHFANATTTIPTKSPESHTSNSILAISDRRMGRQTFVVQHFDPHKADKAYEELDLQLHIFSRNSIHDLNVTTLKARLDDLVKAVARETISNLYPDLPEDSNHSKDHNKKSKTSSPSPRSTPKITTTTTTPITSTHSMHQEPRNDPEAAPTNGPVPPKPLKEYPPYIFIPDTQRRAAKPAYFQGSIPRHVSSRQGARTEAEDHVGEKPLRERER